MKSGKINHSRGIPVRKKKVTAFKGVGLFLGADRADTTVIYYVSMIFTLFLKKVNKQSKERILNKIGI